MSGKKKILYGIIVALGILIDQVSKWFTIEQFFKPDGTGIGFGAWLTTLNQPRLEFIRTPVTSFFDLVMVWNQGVSFGLFSNNASLMPIILSVFAILLSTTFGVWLMKSTRITTALPICLIIAGALSNVWDRARFGAVADFYDVYIGTYHWPAFNIADSFIVIGVILLTIDTVFIEPKQNSK